ncbi:mannitol-1-phosphate 5-dehydrogenase [Brevibacillus fulvus]|uniref:Mannitol-1-phosphate 5-dehydrogenase n=1 Tax=Brevibacillus fulvus TaxID=1125967 RepID=A0A938Y4D7_9BACL|nr:mannitol-1-phosphate 5-dehydrogenase [Brevibacillus fulvus]MBM7591387.1 mannitol-1-phosphate 5-dehydrogenase [Brevibacillus fulvus]
MLAIHFGAGNIGRGFIGQLLNQAGYEVCFVDVNQELVDEINRRKAYTVKLANQEQTAYSIEGVRALQSQNEEEVARAIAGADLVTTAVGPNILKLVAPVIAKGISRRLAENKHPLNVIACENMIGGSSALRSFVEQHLTAAEQELAKQQIGFPDAAVDRIVPLQKHEDKLLVTVEPFFEWVVNESQVKGELPKVEGITFVPDLEPYIERKLYTVNTGHAAVAYLGYVRQIETVNKAILQEDIVNRTRQVLEETGALLVAKYQFDRAQHAAYIEKIIGRFQNPFISDEVTRVGRSPIRKLSPQDRLTGPALQALQYGIRPVGLTGVIAAALLFDYPEDPEALQLQRDLQETGLAATVEKYTGITPDHELYPLIESQYESLRMK